MKFTDRELTLLFAYSAYISKACNLPEGDRTADMFLNLISGFCNTPELESILSMPSAELGVMALRVLIELDSDKDSL